MHTLADWVEQVKNSENLIVVEGKKDARALQTLGITNVVMLYKKPLFQIIEEISQRSTAVIILTDFDAEGKHLYGILNSELQRHGVQVDRQFREFLQKNTHLSHIEGLATLVRREPEFF